jgi:prepilin-type N-terminal cleavage/methylation domain-containing protein
MVKAVPSRRAPNPASARHRGYTLVEMLTTVAVLLIGLGLMVSLARHVRASSADDLTKDLLRNLDQAMARYVAQNGGVPPAVPPFIADQETTVDEGALAIRAESNDQATVALLKKNHVFPAELFQDLSIFYFDGLTVRDAWGSPIVFMPHMHPAVGMAAKGWFFFSAGPDRQYTTKSDNLYSYELPGVER